MLERLDSNDDVAADIAVTDRRRPGRIEYDNPHLINLLRAAPGRPPALHRSPLEADSLAAARGMALSSIAGAMMWVVILVGLWLALHP